MGNNQVFRDWIPRWFVNAALIFCMLHSMILLSLYSANVTYSSSYFDVEPEDMQFALSVTYGTFLATILIESRFFKYFPTRWYLMGIYLMAAVTIFFSAFTQNYYQFIVFRVIGGVLMALPWIPLRLLLLSNLRTRNAVIIAFSCAYGTLLISAPVIMNLAVWLLDWFEWKYMAYASAAFQLVCMGLIFLIFNEKRFYEKFPLNTLDWASYVILVLGILSGAFVLVYGEKKYWFESQQIISASITSLVCASVFILRQLAEHNPTFDFKVFQFRNLRVGFLLFVLYYISRATLNITNSTMATVWNWEPLQVAQVQWLNIFGVIVGVIFSAVALTKHTHIRHLFVLGFGMLAAEHLWFTFLFVPDVSLQQIAIPYIIQGVSVGIIFVPLVMYVVSSVPAYLSSFAGTIGVTGRFWGATLGFSIMQNAQIYLQRQHYNKLQQYVNPAIAETQTRVANAVAAFMQKGFTPDEAQILALKQINKDVIKQSILLTDMEIFTVVGVGLVMLTFYILVNTHIHRSFTMFRNIMRGGF